MSFCKQLQHQIHQAPPFVPAFSSLGGHGQTLLAHFLPSSLAGLGAHQLVEIQMPGGDRLIGCHYSPNGSQERGVLHIFHGLGGSTRSAYMLRAAQLGIHLGLHVILWNHRGCGEGRGLALETYHSGRSDDLARAVRWGRKHLSHLRQILIGYSLSGNATILLSAGVVPALSPHPFSEHELSELVHGDFPDFCIAVSPPLDLHKSALRLCGKSTNIDEKSSLFFSRSARLYGQRFIFDLIASLKDREQVNLSTRPESLHYLQAIAQQARKNLRIWDNVMMFDEEYTSRAAGFLSHLDYYSRASCAAYLGRQQVPLVLLTAADDPITLGLSDCKLPIGLNHSSNIAIDLQSSGGHMGFVDKSVFWFSRAIHTRWLEIRLGFYLESFLDAQVETKKRFPNELHPPI